MMTHQRAQDLRDQIARAMEIDPDLLPLLPDLLAELEELGSDSARLIDLLDGAGFDFASTSLDLGCGKGALAVTLARRGGRVVAVDGLEAFVEAARRRAGAASVAERCEFRVGDVRAATGLGRVFDLVALVSVGAVWGDAARTIGAMRGLTRPGGMMLFEDAWLPDGRDAPPGYEGTPTLEALTRALGSAGDEILIVDTPDLETVRQYNARDLRAIEAAADRLSARWPERAEAIGGYVAEQERQCALMNGGHVRASTFLLRRARA